MSDRLKELQRHRAMLQEHLAWLDREIAAMGGSQPAAATPPPSVGVSPLPPDEQPKVSPFPPTRPAPAFPPPSRVVVPLPSPVSTKASEAAAEEIMARFQRESESTPTKVKLGCFMYFFLALGMVALVVFIFYLRTLRHS